MPLRARTSDWTVAANRACVLTGPTQLRAEAATRRGDGMSETTIGRTDSSEPTLSVTAVLAAISVRLPEAAALAKAALVYRAGSECKAMRILSDLDVPLSEAQTLHGAICLIGRINRTAAWPTVPAD